MGQDAHIFYGQNTTVGVFPHATGRFDPYVLGYSSFIISYVKKKEGNTKNTFSFDSETNFLRTGLSSHCLWNKGRFAHPNWRLTPAIGQDAHSNVRK